MSDLRLTVEMLKKAGACGDAIRFVKVNKLEGFPMDLISEIKGDYNGFLDWLSIREFDDNGNVTKINLRTPVTYNYDSMGFRTNACICGDNITFEYDERGNLSVETSTDKSVIEHEYDSNNNLIRSSNIKESRGPIVIKYEYDRNNNLIKRSFCDSNNGWNCRTRAYEYDERGNLVNDIGGDDIFYTYDDNNNLIEEEGSTFHLWMEYDDHNNLTKENEEVIGCYEYSDCGHLLKANNMELPYGWWNKVGADL